MVILLVQRGGDLTSNFRPWGSDLVEFACFSANHESIARPELVPRTCSLRAERADRECDGSREVLEICEVCMVPPWANFYSLLDNSDLASVGQQYRLRDTRTTGGSCGLGDQPELKLQSMPGSGLCDAQTLQCASKQMTD